MTGLRDTGNSPVTERRFRYRVVLGCGHRTKPVTESTHAPTTAAVAKCDECGRHVPVVLEVINRG